MVNLKRSLQSLLMGSYFDGGIRYNYVHIASQGL